MSLKKIVIAILLAPVALIVFYYSLSHIYSNLPVTSISEKDDQNFTYTSRTPEEAKAHDEWREKNTWHSEVNVQRYIFPYYSPDGRHYVTMRYQPVMGLWVMEMYRTADNRLLGSYSSHRISIKGWRPDSSGVYVRRLGMSHGGGFIKIGPNFDGPLVVALVPAEPQMRNDVKLLGGAVLVFTAWLIYLGRRPKKHRGL